MLQWAHGEYGITIAADREYTDGSADNVNSYQHVYLLNCNGRGEIGSRCSIRVTDDIEEHYSCILLAAGGPTTIDERSVIPRDDSCIVAVGQHVVAVSLPELGKQWSTIVDEFHCEGIYEIGGTGRIITRGSNRITCLSSEGRIIWQLKGGYLFIKGFQLHDQYVEIIAWDDTTRRIEISTGREISRSR